MEWEYCTQHRWEEVGEYEIDLEQKNLCVVTDKRGVQHTLLKGKALERQAERTPPPKDPALKVETAPVASEPIPPSPEAIEVLVEEALTEILSEVEPIPEVVEAIVASFNSEGRGIARVTRRFKRDGFAVIRIDQKDVITEGELYEGRLIRCRVAPPDPAGSLYNAREIEIYRDLTAQNAGGDDSNDTFKN